MNPYMILALVGLYFFTKKPTAPVKPPKPYYPIATPADELPSSLEPTRGIGRINRSNANIVL